MKRPLALVLLAAALAAVTGCRAREKPAASAPPAGKRGGATSVYKSLPTPAPPRPRPGSPNATARPSLPD